MFREEIAIARSPAARIVEDIHSIRRDQDRALDRLHGHSPDLDQLKEMNDAANRHRELFADLEMTVPTPRPDEHPADYNVRLLTPLQRFSRDWRDTDLRRLALSGERAFDPFARVIRADAQRIASNRTIGSLRMPGQLRRIERPGEVSYHGHPLAWMSQFLSPLVLQVERFRGR